MLRLVGHERELELLREGRRQDVVHERAVERVELDQVVSILLLHGRRVARLVRPLTLLRLTRSCRGGRRGGGGSGGRGIVKPSL